MSESHVVIPWEQLSDEALSALIDEFILREGTDYGAVEISLATKHQQIKSQLVRGEIKIVFDNKEQSASIVPKEFQG